MFPTFTCWANYFVLSVPGVLSVSGVLAALSSMVLPFWRRRGRHLDRQTRSAPLHYDID